MIFFLKKSSKDGISYETDGGKKMSKASEMNKFEAKYPEDTFEVGTITGALGIGAGRSRGQDLWTASITLVAWKNLSVNQPAVREELRLEWLADDAEWERAKHLMDGNSVVRLQVRKAEKSMMLVQVLETDYRDDELTLILREELEPVYYRDERLGEFLLDKAVKLFEQKISWSGEEGRLYFDWHEDPALMKSALNVAYALVQDQVHWNAKFRRFAAEQLLESARDWQQEEDEEGGEEISLESFMARMGFSSLSVYPDGDFVVYFDDGDLFFGHSILVNGNVNGELSSAEIAG